MKQTPHQIWSEYQRIKQYMADNNLFEIVKTNENFFDGRQWEGIKADNLPKPVINVLQRVVKYMVATLASNDIGISITPMTAVADDIERMRPVSQEIENIIENARIKEASKLTIRNSAVDGSCYCMQIFNPDFETGQEVKGRIENHVIDNTNVFYGNPYSNDTQTQPWIIVSMRQNVGQVRREAMKLGLKKDEIELIKPDNDGNQANDDSTDLVTVLLKYYKKSTKSKRTETYTDLDGNECENTYFEENETVWFTKSTKDVMLISESDLGYRRYPIACFGWDMKKNSYLYNSPMTAVIPNQIFINKCYAIAQMYGLQSAFPKVVFDKSKVDIEEFLNSTSPSAVAGIDMMGKYLDFVKIPDFSDNIIALVQDVMQQTKECMGVNDASLGNVKAENTSAIIALQEASSVPLELQRQGFYQFWEDVIRNIIDIMGCTYGTRKVMMDDETLAVVDFSVLKALNFSLNVDIGNGSQFSEVAQINTLDKLFQFQVIDAETYVEAIPQKYIPNKSKILHMIRERGTPAMQAMNINTEDEKPM